MSVKTFYKAKNESNVINIMLAIPIPTIIGQKAWREEHVANIYAAIKALVAAINAECDKQSRMKVYASLSTIHTLIICRISISR